MFIAIEGIDGLGKSTLCKRLLPVLRQRMSRTVVLTRDPDDSPFGTFVRDLWRSSRDAEAVYWPLIFAAASTMAQSDNSGLGRDVVLLSDRCALSTFAYCHSAETPLSWIEDLHTRYRYPGLTIFLDIDPGIAANRLWADGREFEGSPARLQTLRERYLVALDFWKARHRPVVTFALNSTVDPDELTLSIVEIILNFGEIK
jgi:Thymidylate kinase